MLKDTAITLSICGNKLPNSGYESLVAIEPGFLVPDMMQTGLFRLNDSYYTLVIRDDISYIIKSFNGICSYGGTREGRLRIGISIPKGMSIHDPYMLIQEIEDCFKQNYMNEVSGIWHFKNETANPALFQQIINHYPLLPTPNAQRKMTGATTGYVFTNDIQTLLKDFQYPEFVNYSEIIIAKNGEPNPNALNIAIPRVHTYQIQVQGPQGEISQSSQSITATETCSRLLVKAQKEWQEDVQLPDFSVASLSQMPSCDMVFDRGMISLDKASETIFIRIHSYKDKTFKGHLTINGANSYSGFRLESSMGETAQLDNKGNFTIVGRGIANSWKVIYTGMERYSVIPSGPSPLQKLPDGTFQLVVSVSKASVMPLNDNTGASNPASVDCLPVTLYLPLDNAYRRPQYVTTVQIAAYDRNNELERMLVPNVLIKAVDVDPRSKKSTLNRYSTVICLPKSWNGRVVSIELWFEGSKEEKHFKFGNSENGSMLKDSVKPIELKEEKYAAVPKIKSGVKEFILGAILGLGLSVGGYFAYDLIMNSEDKTTAVNEGQSGSNTDNNTGDSSETPEGNTNGDDNNTEDLSEEEAQKQAEEEARQAEEQRKLEEQKRRDEEAKAATISKEYNASFAKMQSLDFNFADLQTYEDWFKDYKSLLNDEQKRKFGGTLNALKTIKSVLTDGAVIPNRTKEYSKCCDKKTSPFSNADVRKAIWNTYGQEDQPAPGQGYSEKQQNAFNAAKMLFQDKNGSVTFNDLLNLEY